MSDWWKPYLFGTLAIMAVIALWQAVVVGFGIPEIVLPKPSEVLRALVTDYPHLLIHTWVTAYEILIGFVVGTLLGMITALAMTQFPTLRAIVYPLIIASQTTPKIAIAPLMIIWFGVGIFPKIIVIALLAFFPVLINTIAGLQSTDERHVSLMRTIDATEVQIYREIRLPTAIPYIFAGLKLGITVSVIGAIVSEWVASTQGLGYLLLFYTQYLDMARTFAVLVVLVLLGVACFVVVAVAERYLSWDVKLRSAQRVTTAEASL